MSLTLRPGRRALLAAAVLAALARGGRAAAQPVAGAPRDSEPRASLLLHVGAGGTPALHGLTAPAGSAPAVLAGMGALVRPARFVFLDASTEIQSSFLLGDDLAIGLPPGGPYRRYASRVRDQDVLWSSAVRAGVEGHSGPGEGPLVRFSAGGGYVWTLAAPFLSAAAGVETHGADVRLVGEIEHRWLRLPLEEFTVGAGSTQTVVGTRHLSAGSTLIRLGLEVPVRWPAPPNEVVHSSTTSLGTHRFSRVTGRHRP